MSVKTSVLKWFSSPTNLLSLISKGTHYILSGEDYIYFTYFIYLFVCLCTFQ